MKIKAYHKDFDYTYTLGVFETIELLQNKPDLVLRVYIKSNSSKNKGIAIINELCKKNKIDLIESDNTINKLSKKENCFAVAIIKKYTLSLDDTNHVVLVNPSDMGNMGTIIRTMLGFNYVNLAIIRPGVDVFDPRVIRALVFGNESSGLPDEFLDYGQSIFIPHSEKIDSLNLSMALGITLCHFSKDIFKSKEVLR